MPSSYTTSLKLTLPATGELTGTWGDTVNTGITTLVDAAVAGTASVTMTDANYTLTSVDGASDESRRMFVVLAGTLSASRNVICPAASKLYFVKNSTTGGFAITFKTSAGTGISVPNGAATALYCDGTNVLDATNYSSALNLGTALSVASGGTGVATLAANNVILGNGTSAVQVVAPGSSGNVLTSNGTTWASAAVPAGGLTYLYRTTNYTAADKQGVLSDTSGGSFTVTLPISPTVGMQVVVADAGAAWGTNNLTVGRNGSTIGGLAEDLVCNITGASVQLVYDGTTWEVYAQIGGNGGNAVTLDGVQTLTNKTLTNPTVTNYTETQNTANTGASITISLTDGTVENLTLTASTTITMPTASAGKSFIIYLKTGAGGFSVTWSTVKWPSSATPSVTTVASRMDIYSFFSDGASWYGTVVGQNYTP